MGRWILLGWRRAGIGLLLAALTALAAAPWLLYAIGLSKIDGRPTRPSQIAVTSGDADALFRLLRLGSPSPLHPLSPYSVAYSLFLGDGKSLGPSAAIARQIARSYN